MVRLIGFDKKGIERARRLGNEELRRSPVSAGYCEETDSLWIRMPNRTRIFIPRRQIRELRGLPIAALRRIRLSKYREAIELDQCDVHISAIGLLRIVVLGQDPYARAGRARSAAKARAARVNGAKGGRPKKAA
jgi:hypothetical protein